jgi:hypothetical protein
MNIIKGQKLTLNNGMTLIMDKFAFNDTLDPLDIEFYPIETEESEISEEGITFNIEIEILTIFDKYCIIAAGSSVGSIYNTELQEHFTEIK